MSSLCMSAPTTSSQHTVGHCSLTQLSFTFSSLQGIRIIKFYAWEGPFATIVRKARAAEEYPILKHAYWMMMGLQAIFLQLPNLLLLSVFATHVLRNGSMEPSVVWVRLFNGFKVGLKWVYSGLHWVMEGTW